MVLERQNTVRIEGLTVNVSGTDSTAVFIKTGAAAIRNFTLGSTPYVSFYFSRQEDTTVSRDLSLDNFQSTANVSVSLQLSNDAATFPFTRGSIAGSTLALNQSHNDSISFGNISFDNSILLSGTTIYAGEVVINGSLTVQGYVEGNVLRLRTDPSRISIANNAYIVAAGLLDLTWTQGNDEVIVTGRYYFVHRGYSYSVVYNGLTLGHRGTLNMSLGQGIDRVVLDPLKANGSINITADLGGQPGDTAVFRFSQAATSVFPVSVPTIMQEYFGTTSMNVSVYNPNGWAMPMQMKIAGGQLRVEGPLDRLNVGSVYGINDFDLTSGASNSDGYVSLSLNKRTIAEIKQVGELNLDAGPATRDSSARFVFDAPETGSGISSIKVYGSYGADTVDVRALPASVTSFTFDGWEGDDRVLIKPSGSAVYSIVGGGGNDRLEVSLSDGDDQVTVDNGGTRILSGDQTLANVSGLEGLSINALSGNDRVHVRSLASALSLAVDGGPGDDTVVLSSQAPDPGVLNTLQGPMTLVGGAGSDRLVLENSSDTATNIAVLRNNSVEGMGLGNPVGYSQFETLDVLLGSGNDIVTVHGTASGSQTNLRTKAGNDEVTLTMPLDGKLFIDGGDGADKITARGATGYNSSQILGPGAEVTHANVETIVTDSGSGGGGGGGGGGYGLSGREVLLTGKVLNSASTSQAIFVNHGANLNDAALVVYNMSTGARVYRYVADTSWLPWLGTNDRSFVADVNADGLVELVQVNRRGSAGEQLTGGAIRILDLNTNTVVRSWNYNDSVGGQTYAALLDELVDPEDAVFVGHFTQNTSGHLELLFFNRSTIARDKIALRTIDLVTGEVTFSSYHDGSIFAGWVDSTDEAMVSDTNFDGYDDLVLINRVPDPQNYRSTNIGFVGMVSIRLLPGGSSGPYRGFYRFFDWNFAMPGENSVFPGYDELDDKATSGLVINNAAVRPVLLLVNSSSRTQAAYAVLEPRPLVPGVRDSFQLIATIFHGADNNGFMDPDDAIFLGDLDLNGSAEVWSYDRSAGPRVKVFDTFRGNVLKELTGISGTAGFAAQRTSADAALVFATLKEPSSPFGSARSGGSDSAANGRGSGAGGSAAHWQLPRLPSAEPVLPSKSLMSLADYLRASERLFADFDAWWPDTRMNLLDL